MQDQQSVIWNLANTWNNYGEPARPNPSETKIVDQHIQPKAKVLLLGSTPEYRDLLANKSCEITIVDYSQDNFLAMTSLMTEEPTQETFIQGDWRKIELTEKFDLILGDHIINLLPITDWQVLLENFKRLLKPTGQLLQRAIVRPPSYKKSLEAIFEHTQTLLDKTLFAKVFYDLIFLSLDENTQSTNLGTVWNLVKQANSNQLLNKEQLAYFEHFSWEGNQFNAFFSTAESLLTLLNQVFDNNQIIHGDLYYKDFTFFIESKAS